MRSHPLLCQTLIRVCLLGWFFLHSISGTKSLFAQDSASPEPRQSEQRDSAVRLLPLGMDAAQVIDLALAESWQQQHLTPAGLTSDAAFARRLYLDLVGRIPSLDELEQFLKGTDSRKRELLIDQLLSSSEYAAHFAQVFDVLLTGRSEGKGEQRRNQAGWHDYLQQVFSENRPWNEVSQEILLARPEVQPRQGANFYLVSRNDKHQEIAEAVAKDFFGVRIDCAQCHDHPLASEIEQKHYWGLVAFFNRSKNTDTPWGKGLAESAIGGFSEFANVEGKSQPNELVFLNNLRVEEARPAKDAKEEDRDDLYETSSEGRPRIPKFSRRQQFVEKIVKQNPLIATAFVNRMWGWMMGRGLVHPVDTMDSFHPASHPALLDWLARDFALSGYDIRRLLRALARSRAYQLESANQEFTDPQWFTIALTKPLTAEMMHRSWIVVFAPKDVGRWETIEVRREIARQFPEVMPDESTASVSQGLALSNGSLLQELCSADHSQLLSRLGQETNSVRCVEELFQRTLGRSPDTEEAIACQEFLQKHLQRDQALAAVAWSLVTSAEFRFNH